MIGPFLAPYSTDTAVEAERLKIPMFAYQSSTTFTTMPFVFSTVPQENLHASIIVKRAIAAGQKRMAILYAEGHETAVTQIESQYAELMGTITSKHLLDANMDFKAILSEVFLDEPETIALLSNSTVGIPVLNAFSLNYPASQTTWRMWGTMCDNKLLADVSSFETMHQEIVSIFTGGDGIHVSNYVEAYMARFPESGRASGFGQFDAVHALALAIEAAKSTDHAAVREALEGISKGGTPYTWEQYGEAVAALGRGEDIDYSGVSSPFDWDDSGDLTPESSRFFFCLAPSKMIVPFSATNPL